MCFPIRAKGTLVTEDGIQSRWWPNRPNKSTCFRNENRIELHTVGSCGTCIPHLYSYSQPSFPLSHSDSSFLAHSKPPTTTSAKMIEFCLSPASRTLFSLIILAFHYVWFSSCCILTSIVLWFFFVSKTCLPTHFQVKDYLLTFYFLFSRV